MAPRFSSEPRSTSSWLRRDDAPSVMDSMESSSSIWSMRILAESAISASVASAASKTRSSGRGPADEAAGATGAASETTSGAGDSATGSSSSGSGSGSVSVANSTAASRSALSTSTVLWAYSGSLRVLVARPATVGELFTPISTNRSTPSPPAASSMNSRSCVSIQRTGLANCHASSSMNTVRAISRGRSRSQVS
ncbi:Uncharacterised protein [Mycobacterium tuberculosis]|nr:Uncharacterised protein [Mycobacterium tuberculosis]CFB95563.1 Uncharacterised protein [Mycobacterium tuberculosis]CFR91145.1 Uncharacterised protein [Mycobacterium tuberculosis]CFS14194.1 Uncharacterised protein [Mycobacterium tuberculosis]CFS18754.1 Uncharacterised protein [Mycobacterium tuberculosis]